MVCRDVGTQTFTQVIRFFVMIVPDRISVGIKVDRAKIELIVKFSPPNNQKGVRNFSGNVGCYMNFIETFTRIALPTV